MSNGTVEIHGKTYETVALRVKKFRDKHPTFTLRTDIKRLDEEMCVMEAQILDDAGRLLSNGHAQEFRQSSSINRTSYVENCETSAIGRALASFGLGGTEFSTADEVAHAITGKKGPEPHGKATSRGGVFDKLPPDMQTMVMDIAANVRTLLMRGDIAGALDEVNAYNLEADPKVALWDRLDSKERSALAKERERRTELERKAA